VNLADDAPVFFADFGEPVTVQSVAAVGIFNLSADVVLGEVLTSAPSLELPATVAAAEGGTVVVRGVSYVIRQALLQPPDGVVQTLVLARV